MPIVVPGSLDRGRASPDERRALFACLIVVLEGMRAAGMLNDAVRVTDAPPAPFGLGAKGPIVKAWQAVLGPLYKGTRDGDFGPATLAAHKDWAKKLGFGDVSVVTPAMWATGVGVTLILQDGGAVLPDGSIVSIADAERASKDLIPAPEKSSAPA